ncbi:MAG: type II toxin-antitoxin system HicB family antitoxin [Phycisphaerae bacterium]
MKEYLVIYEKGTKGWGAFSPDVPGCIATGKTRAEVKNRFRQAIVFHLQGLREAGLPLPNPSCKAETLPVAI